MMHAARPELGIGDVVVAEHLGSTSPVVHRSFHVLEPRVWPSPWTTYFSVVSSRSPMGPRACSFWVEMPISAPNPNSSPSTNRVEALTSTAAASTSCVNRSAASRSPVTIASLWPLP